MDDELIKIIVGSVSAGTGAVIMKLWSDYQTKAGKKGKSDVLNSMYTQLEELYQKNLEMLEASKQNQEKIKQLTDENNGLIEILNTIRNDKRK